MWDTLLLLAIIAGIIFITMTFLSLFSCLRLHQRYKNRPTSLDSHAAFECPVEKAIRVVGTVRFAPARDHFLCRLFIWCRGDLESSLALSMLPLCFRRREIKRQIDALREVEALLADPTPLHMPDVLQAVHSGDILADKDIEAWLSYELANKSLMIDNWLVSREQYLQSEAQKKHLSRSPSIISMRDSTQVSAHLQMIGSWDFDVFSLVDQQKEELPLAAVGFCLFLKHDLFNKLNLNMDTVETLMAMIDDAYSKNPYHCNMHGAEVAHTISYMLMSGGFYHLLKPTDVCAMVLGALCHDIAHPGQTNHYHIATQSEVALRYNNIAVLENFHAAFTRKLLRKPEANIFSKLDSQAVKEVEELLISVILATDMSTNFECCAKFRRSQAAMSNSRRSSNNSRSASIDPIDVTAMLAHRESFFTMMQMCIKCADISHCVKKWEIHKRFTDMIAEEFYIQGDLEREANIPISPYMDRYALNCIPKNQIGFFQFLVQPAWQSWMTLCPLPEADTNLNANLKEWERLAALWNTAHHMPVLPQQQRLQNSGRTNTPSLSATDYVRGSLSDVRIMPQSRSEKAHILDTSS